MNAPRLNVVRRLAPVVIAWATLAIAGVWAAPQGALQTNPQPPRRQYSGPIVDMDLSGADLRGTLRALADYNRVNMVINPSVKGSVDIKLTAVPWDQAFEMVLKSNKLGYVLEDSVIRVVPLSELEAEEKARQNLTSAQKLAGTTEIRTFALNYAEATKVAPLLTKTVLSTRGQISIDERINMLIVSDLPSYLPAIEDLIRTLDQAQPQVEIEARIVETDKSSARALGIQWGLKGTSSSGNNSVLAGISLAPTVTTSGINLAMGSVGGLFNLDVELDALEKSGKGRILSTPSVVTQNNHEAEMTQGFQIPIQTVSNNTVTVTFKDAALKLTVTPQIIKTKNAVLLHVQLENGFPDFSKAVNGVPSIRTQRAITQVQVDDGVTTVIGGILSSTETSNLDTTPGLSRIPLLGWLFKRTTSSVDAEELLIFSQTAHRAGGNDVMSTVDGSR